jgi:hypothetical protein
LTNVKGWKDEDEGHRADDSRAATIDVSSSSSAHLDDCTRQSASDIALHTSAAEDAAAIDVDVQTRGEPVEDYTADSVQAAQAPIAHITQVERKDIDGSDSTTHPAAPSSLPPAGSQSLDISNIATRTETHGDLPPHVHGVASTAAAAAAAASIASAAAEMFRGQLEAITTSGSVIRCCGIFSLNFICSGCCRNSWF